MLRQLYATLSAVFALSCAGAATADVGFQHLRIPDGEGGTMEVGVWYPTATAAGGVAPDASLRGDQLPLVVMSHGNGGLYSGHADTAVALAEAGFVAAALTHPRDNWRDQSGATSVWERPRHFRRLTDYMLTGWPDHARIDQQRIGAFGYSAGGFTVLVAAGGEPDLTAVFRHCREHPDFFDCQLAARNPPATTEAAAAAVAWTHDPRIRAVVAAAPALGFAFGSRGLARVNVPVQLWRAADDAILPHPFYAEAVRTDLPNPPEAHVVEGAGHFDFLPTCSAELAESAPMICSSAPGFDRAGFHADFNRSVVTFFLRTLSRE